MGRLMKIVYWNRSKKKQPLSGFKRYEEELYKKMQEIAPSFDIQRIQRSDNLIFGSIFFSFLFKYTTKNADIVHATYQTLAPIVYLRKPKKFILTVLDLIPIVYPEVRTDKIQWIFSRYALKRSDKIIAISFFTKNEIIRLCGIDEKKIEVIYLGVDHTRYFPKDRSFCKKQLGLDENDKHILIVSSNLPHKRMDIAKKVFNKVREEYPNVKLLKVGYGDILAGDGIINLGLINEEDMHSIYNASDIYLHTSEYEGFGLPVLEAMACGIPVIVTNCASLPEIVGDCGHLIDLADPNFIDNFSNAILLVLREGNTKKVVERSKLFTWEKTAMQTLHSYQKVIK